MSTTARVITACQRGLACDSIAGNREAMLPLVDKATREKPDLIVLPETFLTTSVPHERWSLETAAEKLDGPTITAASRRAKAARCYIVVPLITVRDGIYYNSAVIIDRAGEVAGVYDKMQPVTHSFDYTSVENGVMPGREASVFDFDFGPVGIQICFDAMFPAGWASLAERGAKIVLWCSAYTGGLALQSYAYTHQYYVISAVQNVRSVVVNPCGQVVAQGAEGENLLRADINLDFVVAHLDYNYGITEQIERAYPGKVNMSICEDEGRFLVEPRCDGLTCESLRREFAFESVSEYLARHERSYRALRAGVTPEKQNALHGDREQYE